MRTISVTEASDTSPPDIDGNVADDLDSLRQRIAQRLQFPLGSWDIDNSLGTERVLGTLTSIELVDAAYVEAILDEGGDEVLAVHDAVTEINPDTRVLTFSCRVETVYGDMPVTQQSL